MATRISDGNNAGTLTGSEKIPIGGASTPITTPADIATYAGTLDLSTVAHPAAARNNIDALHDRYTFTSKDSGFSTAIADFESGTSVKTSPLYLCTASFTVTLRQDSDDSIPVGFTIAGITQQGFTTTFAAGSGASVETSSGGTTVVCTSPEQGVFWTATKRATNTWFVQNGRASSSYKNIVKLGSDVVNNNATPLTFQDVTGLQFAVTSGKTYWFRFFCMYDSAATTTGSGWSINGPTTTYLGYYSNFTGGASTISQNQIRTAYDSPATATTTSGTAGNTAIIEGFITPSANGNVVCRFLSEVASSAITAKANMCYVEYILMA